MANQFRRAQHHDHTILNGRGNVVGHVRVKPSGILWAPTGSSWWYRVSLKDFAKFLKKNGKRQKM